MDFIYYNSKLTARARELRKNSTLSEILLWNELKNKKILGFRFLRQRPIYNYIIDFYCNELKLAIEIDGLIHDTQIDEDIFRQKELESLGVFFLRFTDKEVRLNMEKVIEKITIFINKQKSKNNSPNSNEGVSP